MKKLIFTVIASTLLLSCSQNDDEIGVEDPNQKKEVVASRLGFGENVKLIKAKDTKLQSCSRVGCESIAMREYMVEVSNLAYNKSVAVHQQLNNGQWEDFYLAYSFTTNVGTEIWKGFDRKSVRGAGNNAYGEQLAVKYVVNGQTYWDSNNGSNYAIDNTNREPNSSFLYLNQSFNILQTKASLFTSHAVSYANVNVDVRNIGFAKEVKMVYSTDNWASTNTHSLTFKTYDYTDPLNSTTAFERWEASFSLPVTNKVVYALSYNVNGQTYWDNNFGNNYMVLSN